VRCGFWPEEAPRKGFAGTHGRLPTHREEQFKDGEPAQLGKSNCDLWGKHRLYLILPLLVKTVDDYRREERAKRFSKAAGSMAGETCLANTKWALRAKNELYKSG